MFINDQTFNDQTFYQHITDANYEKVKNILQTNADVINKKILINACMISIINYHKKRSVIERIKDCHNTEYQTKQFNYFMIFCYILETQDVKLRM